MLNYVGENFTFVHRRVVAISVSIVRFVIYVYVAAGFSILHCSPWVSNSVSSLLS
jgi:hypothetical protein